MEFSKNVILHLFVDWFLLYQVKTYFQIKKITTTWITIHKWIIEDERDEEDKQFDGVGENGKFSMVIWLRFNFMSLFEFIKIFETTQLTLVEHL